MLLLGVECIGTIKYFMTSLQSSEVLSAVPGH